VRATLALLLLGCASTPMPPSGSADLVVLGTGAAASAPSAVAVEGSRITAVGSRDDVLRLRGPQTRLVDSHGGTIVPALTDAHGHLVGLGFAMANVDLRGCTSARDCADRIRAALGSAAAGAWIQGRGWDQNRFPDKQFPTRATLDAVAPSTPVFVRRIDGHAAWANSEALRRAKITRHTPDPPGGRILHDAHGEPTGLLIDRADELVQRAIPLPGDAEVEAAIFRAQDLLASQGLTSIHEMGIDAQTTEVYRRVARAGRLKLRVYAHWSGEPKSLEEAFRRGPERGGPDDLFTLRAIKLYADGALGSRGAHLKAPYSDDPTNSGLVLTPPEEIEAIARRALAAGFQVSTHAIGDAANHDVLEAYARAGTTPAARFRIEHAQITDPADIPRFAQLGVIASMQPTHATSDMSMAEARLGHARLAGAYAWRRFLEAHVHVAFGSDFPVELSDPRLGLFAAVTRTDLDGQPPGGWLPDQKLTVAEALRGFTQEAAYAAFEEGWRGELRPGQVADLTVFDGPLDSPAHILERKPLLTVVGGHIVSEAKAPP
jgi:predicted amidohydrolase YtcJ